MKYFPLIGILLLVCIMATGCSSPQFNIVGTWKDATGKVQTYYKDGTCQHVFATSDYTNNPNKPKSKFSLSHTPNKDGFYELNVSESAYLTTKFNVKVINNNEIEIYFSNKNTPGYSDKYAIYKLTRQ